METEVSVSIEQDQIQAIIDKKIIGIYNRDEHAVLSVYAPDVVSFDLAPPLQNQGIAGIKKRLQGWFASYMGHITQKVADVKIMVDQEIAFSHSFNPHFWHKHTGRGTGYVVPHHHLLQKNNGAMAYCT